MTDPDGTTPKRGPGRPRKNPLPSSAAVTIFGEPTTQPQAKPARSNWVQSDSTGKMLNLSAWQSIRVVDGGSGQYQIELLNQFPNGGGFTTAKVYGLWNSLEDAIKAMREMVGA